jgi:hypothetical protein
MLTYNLVQQSQVRALPLTSIRETQRLFGYSMTASMRAQATLP